MPPSASKFEIKQGNILRLRFGVCIHEDPADSAAAYQQYLKLLAML